MVFFSLTNKNKRPSRQKRIKTIIKTIAQVGIDSVVVVRSVNVNTACEIGHVPDVVYIVF